MSRLSELIAELCPDGVEYKTLGELICKTSNIKWSEHPNAIYQYIDLASVDRVYHRIVSTTTINAKNAPSRAQQIVATGDILFGATRPTLMRYCEVPDEYDGQIASTGYAVLRVKSSCVLPRYLMYCLDIEPFVTHLETFQRGSAYPAISMRDLKLYRIPTPPIKVQHEIVSIFDAYTMAYNTLEEQLREESSLRAKQLTALCDELICRPSFERKPLGIVGQLERGKRFTAADYVDGGIPSIHYGEVYTNYGLSASKTVSTVRTDMASNLRYAHPGDVVIACTGENKDDICKPVAWLGSTDAAVHDDCQILRHSSDARFIAYALMTSEFSDQKIRVASESKVVRVSGKNLASLVIPLPTIETQRDIADKLDEALSVVKNLTSTIDEEASDLISQFAHVRYQLLSFPEKAA